MAKKILVRYKDTVNILAIRQLYLMRPHPVLLKEYYPSEEKIDQQIDGKNIIIRAFNLFKYFFFETDDYYVDKLNINNLPKNKNCLFISHLINENHLKKKEDFYFGNLVNFLKNKDFFPLIVLRNLTQKNSKTIFKNNKRYFKDKILLSKSLCLVDEFKLIINIFITYINLIILKISDKDIKNFLSNKNVFKFAGSTYNNLKLMLQIERIVKIYKPNYLFLTCEGHSWEKLIIRQINKKFPKIKIFSYQFSIITKHSSSIFLNLDNQFNPDFYLTTGNYTKKLFSKKFNTKLRCINIGSNKFTPRKKLKKNSKDILILPEGFNSETLKMIEFSVEAANKYKNKRFIFRFHPMMNSSLFMKSHINGKIKIPKNLKISKNLFDQDLEASKYIIYRGSAAAIQALASNKIVIYLKFDDEINIDPLYMLKYKFYVNQTNELKKIFENKKIMKKNYLNIKFTKEYFDKPNYLNLLKYLN